MKTLRILPLLLISINPFIIPQSEFNLDAYKQFLHTHQNLSAQDLLNMHETGVFYGDVNENYSDAEYFYQVDSVYKLTAYEKSLISRNGFMVSERLKQMTFGHSFLQIYNQDLPVYISTDAILHALHQSYDRMLRSIELSMLINSVSDILNQSHNKLAVLEDKYSFQPQLNKMLKDVDVYFTVGRKLLDEAALPYYAENSAIVDYYVNKAKAGEGLSGELIFSTNCRKVDWSQFKPRGHYDDEYYPQLAKYFRAMMWLGRTELYLIEPQNVYPGLCVPDFYDVQRQSIMTFLVKELIEISGSSVKYNQVEGILRHFVGEPDNVTIADLEYLKGSLSISGADILLDSLKFCEFQDTLKKQSFAYQKILSQVLYNDPMSPDSIVPASAFLLFGQRFVIDSYVMASVVFDRIEYNGNKICRLYPSTLDPIFALGNDAAAQLLKPEIEQYKYATNLSALRYLIDSYDNSFWNSTIYNQWLNSIKQLNPPYDRTILPSYMKTAAFWQKQLNTQLASWTELRHDNLLYAKQSYTGGTVCSFPYTYVEPFPEFYQAIKNIGTLGKQNFGSLNFPGKVKFINYFSALEATADTLRMITEKELKGEPYTDQEILFLHKVMYPFISGSGEPPYQGWYPNLIFDYYDEPEILLKADYLVADVHTIPTDCAGAPIGAVLHAGTGPVNLGIFIAEVPGFNKTAFIGPVYSYYQYTTLNFERLTDQEWLHAYLYKSARPDWVNIYLADSLGNSLGSGASLITAAESTVNNYPENIFVAENYPNPFNPSTTITFNVPMDKSISNVIVEVYNIQGELVKNLYSGELPGGNYYIQWDGTNTLNSSVSSGVYLCKVSVGSIFKTIKMTLMK